MTALEISLPIVCFVSHTCSAKADFLLFTFISVTEVFIAHGSHCKDCEDAVLSVVTYLNLTGLCKCSIDLCSLPKEWSPGMSQYYENKIAECQKVIVLFTVNENCECEDNIKGKEHMN
jgi:hypothetical protein